MLNALLLELCIRIFVEDGHLHLALLLNKWGMIMSGDDHAVQGFQSRVSWDVTCPIRAVAWKNILILMTWRGNLRAIFSIFREVLCNYHPTALVFMAAEEVLPTFPCWRILALLILHQYEVLMILRWRNVKSGVFGLSLKHGILFGRWYWCRSNLLSWWLYLLHIQGIKARGQIIYLVDFDCWHLNLTGRPRGLIAEKYSIHVPWGWI